MRRPPKLGKSIPRLGLTPGVRHGVLPWGCLLGVLLLAAAGGPGWGADAPAVPVTLGAGTGGTGAWTCVAAAHSPSTLKVDASAGPESTPAAVLEFSFSATQYNWNWATVGTAGLDLSGFTAVRVTYRTEVPAGFASLSVMLRESTGGSYWVPQVLPLSPRRWHTAIVPFSRFTVPAWSKDANSTLDLDLVTAVSIGLETARSGPGRVILADVELLPAGW